MNELKAGDKAYRIRKIDNVDTGEGWHRIKIINCTIQIPDRVKAVYRRDDKQPGLAYLMASGAICLPRDLVVPQ